MTTRWLYPCAACLMAVGLAACRTEAPAAVDDIAPPAGAVSPAAATSDLPQPGAPVVASGTSTLPPQTPLTEVERPQPEQGIQRPASLDDARAAVPFALLEPTTLPEGAELTMVQLVEAPEGSQVPSLPAARLIYDVDGNLMVLYESPATGADAEGEPVTIGGQSGWVKETEQVIILTWERDGVRVELRGTGMGRDALLEVAAGLAPAAE